MSEKVTDLRSALALLQTIPGQLAETDVPVDVHEELAGVYRYVGAGGTVRRPTKEGPAAVFRQIKDFPDCRTAIGLLASRKRVGCLLDCPPDQLGFLLCRSAEHPIGPALIRGGDIPCQQVVHRSDEPGFDVRKLIPANTFTPGDGAPCITMGLCRASDPETGISDVTIHRMFLTDQPDEISFGCMEGGGRHIGAMIAKAEKAGKPLPISVAIGLDPAVYIGSCFCPPATPYGYDELGIAGAIRGQAVELAPCISIPETTIANAEFVIEGEIVPGKRVREDVLTGSGGAIPEFPGYVGGANTAFVIRVKAVTHREHPIYQTCIGPSEEHVSMAGIPTEACIIDLVEKTLPGRLKNVYAHSSGGGKFMAVLQICKREAADEGMQRQIALLAFSAFEELKHIILVDEDVDPFDSSDVLWALNTRYQGDIDTICVPGVRCHPGDPTACPEYSPFSRRRGIACKTAFDCTVPFDMKEKFRRAPFPEADWKKFFPQC